ncbi:MAG: metal-dependent hydrolase [Pseudomonadota bacterium]
MNFIWLGHGSMRIESGDAVLLIDPWLEGNPSFPDAHRDAVLAGVTHILLTHGHFDHISEVLPLARETKVPVVGQFDLMNHWAEAEGIETIGFNKGGTVDLNGVAATMVPASHSSTLGLPDGPVGVGSEVGFVLRAAGRCVYVSGDTDIMADMAWMGEYYAPDVGILSAGGFFTMDMKATAWAAKKYFNFKTVIPVHYKTFPILEQTADDLIAGLPGVDVKTPEVMELVAL